MKTKTISVAVTDEEYKKINKAMIEDSLKSDKKPNTSAFILDIVLTHINGNTPPQIQDNIQETNQDSSPKDTSIADLNW